MRVAFSSYLWTVSAILSVLTAMAAESSGQDSQLNVIRRGTIALDVSEDYKVGGFSVSQNNSVTALIRRGEKSGNYPEIVRTNTEFQDPAVIYRFRSSRTAGFTDAGDGQIVVADGYGPNATDRRMFIRKIRADGELVAEAFASSDIAATGHTQHGIVYLNTRGGVERALNAAFDREFQLITGLSEFPHSLILPSAVSFFPLSANEVAAINRFTGTLYVGDLRTRTARSRVLQAPALTLARQTYAALKEKAGRELPSGSNFAGGTPCLASTADERGHIYTLVSPYRQNSGATILEFDRQGSFLQAYNAPLNIFPRGIFGPSFLAVRSGTLYLAAPDGKVAVYSGIGGSR